jgi:hypothetical protein
MPDLSSIIIFDLNETNIRPIKAIATEDTKSFMRSSLLTELRFTINKTKASIISAYPARINGFGKRLYE